jgi:hypothetical protein
MGIIEDRFTKFRQEMLQFCEDMYRSEMKLKELTEKRFFMNQTYLVRMRRITDAMVKPEDVISVMKTLNEWLNEIEVMRLEQDKLKRNSQVKDMERLMRMMRGVNDED